MFETALLLTAAFVAGALNAVAGGGSFLTLPALVFVGVPPVVANATGTVALLPGYAAGAWGFREDTQAPPGLSMRLLVVLSLIGGCPARQAHQDQRPGFRGAVRHRLANRL